jgi:DNA-directed RNA polymerase subunit RPC12/RpoP
MRYSYRHYYYLCPKCEKEFDSLKEVRNQEDPATCTQCGHECSQADQVHKQITIRKAKNYTIIGSQVESAEYNPGLGKVVQNKRHRSELAKRMGVVEVGNDYKDPNTIHKEVDREIAQRSEKNYQDALKDIG